MGTGDMETSEGFYPPGDWQTYPEIESCLSVKKHEPHFFIPAFLDPDLLAPDFVCGGWPRKIISIDEKR